MTEIAQKKFEILEFTISDDFNENGLAEKLNELTDLVKKLNIASVGKCYTEKDIDNAYDKGFKDGNQRDLTGSLIEAL